MGAEVLCARGRGGRLDPNTAWAPSGPADPGEAVPEYKNGAVARTARLVRPTAHSNTTGHKGPRRRVPAAALCPAGRPRRFRG
ncbi:hypothetical protein PsYK624_090510 [Phanerochaete sordida]|uniref:Uncharacterized protein n=1 Tax=Phanerochaete sordida TaxID=48140 RepID=A0A9P3LFP2_9APHY|nr:hypothetical protein PsYK624_090510 [Phanerochaete sordida]